MTHILLFYAINWLELCNILMLFQIALLQRQIVGLKADLEAKEEEERRKAAE